MHATCESKASLVRTLMGPEHGAYSTRTRINAGERTKADKLYYGKCLAAQKVSRLPDHCNSDAFTKRAIAFVLFIMPNLTQKYTQSPGTQPTTSRR